MIETVVMAVKPILAVRHLACNTLLQLGTILFNFILYIFVIIFVI